MVKKVLITGAAGFIGEALAERLSREHVELCYAVRQPSASLQPVVFEGEIDSQSDWSAALSDVNVVVHLAARAHVLDERAENPEIEFMRVNFEATVNLVKQCAEAGVAKFIFLSSIGVSVNNSADHVIDERTECDKIQAYAESKLLAERKLQETCKLAGIDLFIVRPPLVYGAMAPGNFGRLLSLARSPLPLPLGLAVNKRNFVSRSNLVDFIAHCIDYAKPVNDIFVVADDEVISTKDVITCLRQGMGRSPRLVPFPPSLFRLLVNALGKPQFYEQLFKDLQVDNSKAKSILGWSPPHSAFGELQKCGSDSVAKFSHRK